MPQIFDFIEYREYLAAWIKGLGEHAYGFKGRVAKALGVSSSLVSQVLGGEKSFTADQASDLCDFLGLNEIESDYLQLLVELDRSGNVKYREKISRRIEQLRAQASRIGKRVPRHKELTDEQRAIYYSSWLYTGVRNLSALPNVRSADAIAERLRLEPATVNRVVRFLIENGLCREEAGALTYGPASVHVDKDSPFANKHHQNWRIQAMQQMERKRDEDVFFTGPMSLSAEAAAQIRRLLPDMIQTIMKISGPSPSETVACLNIDWFGY